jgi:hypothetical protein
MGKPQLRRARLAGAGALAAALLLDLSPRAHGAEDALPTPPSAAELLDRAYQNLYGADFLQILRMTSRSRGGRPVTRRLQLTRKQSTKPGKALLRFLEPYDVRGTSMLMIDQDERSDDVFLYLPALRKVRRISAAQRFDSFFGTDLTYEDLEPKRATDYDASLLGSGAVEGAPCRVVEARARPGVETQYERTVACIEPERAVILRLDFYRAGALFKRLESDPHRIERVGDRYVALDVRVVTQARGSETLVRTESYEIRSGIPDSLFSAANLEGGDEESDRAQSIGAP